MSVRSTLGLALFVGGPVVTMVSSQIWLVRHLDYTIERAMLAQRAEMRALVQSRGAGAEVLRSADVVALAALRQDCAGVGAAAAAPVHGAPPEARTGAEASKAPAGPSVEQEQAYDRANDLLDTALSRGHWMNEDESKFRRAVQETDPGRVEELITSVSRAINDGKLRPSFLDDGVP